MSKRNPDEFKITDPAEMLVTKQPPIDKHPGVFLRETILPQWGLNVAEAARRLGVNRPNLHNVLQGKADVSRDLAYKLGALMRDEVADLLIAHQLQYDLAREREKREAFKATIERMQPVAQSEDA
ncbi:HigA family addiction module antitoxin [Rhizorhabdus histidinilytica]|uniref:Addiction module antidote protein, HigA family n=1 Tax=Rhizorhabdus histidinilytica TaxID=439228 RepID=A0A1T5BVM5_9SPHN|nr:HigA family addiction module antitoxin [Rhizorhabdus histidinilytica]SKB51255.1 addiction module antidote protein, HigA family [Rhizorhabdus histidinilytica]